MKYVLTCVEVAVGSAGVALVIDLHRQQPEGPAVDTFLRCHHRLQNSTKEGITYE